MIIKGVKFTCEDSHPFWHLYVAIETLKDGLHWVRFELVHRESDVYKIVEKNCAILDGEIQTVDITNGTYNPNHGYKSFFVEDEQ